MKKINLELLNSIKDFIKSNDTLKAEYKKDETFRFQKENGKDVVYDDLSSYYFRIDNDKIKTKFNVTIFKKSRFFKNLYIIRLRIIKNTWTENTITIKSNNLSYKSILKCIFNILDKKEKNKQLDESLKKLESYTSEIKKATNPSYLRDNKINDILK